MVRDLLPAFRPHLSGRPDGRLRLDSRLLERP